MHGNFLNYTKAKIQVAKLTGMQMYRQEKWTVRMHNYRQANVQDSRHGYMQRTCKYQKASR
jgi:hypothetical protein